MFKRRDFVLMWIAQLVSTAGSALTDLAAGIFVYQQTGSVLLVGLTLMATAVPSLIVGLIAGVFVDRWDRRRVMLASNLLQAAVVATIPFLLGVDLWLLFVALLVNAGVKQFFDPAYEALIPEIASDEELTAANAFLQIASFGSTAIGFAGAGLLASIDIRLAFWFDALTFLVSAVCIFLMRIRVKMEAPDEDASVGVVVANLKIGIRTIAEVPMLRSLFLLGAPVFFAFGLWNVLLLPMAIKVLGASEFEYGVQEALTSVGFVVGSLFMAKYADRLPDRPVGLRGHDGHGHQRDPVRPLADDRRRDRVRHDQRLLQLAVRGRPPDAPPAPYAARAARPGVLGAVRDARRDLPARHGGRGPRGHPRRPAADRLLVG